MTGGAREAALVADRVVGRLRIVAGNEERRSLTSEVLSVSRPTTIGFVNAHAFNLCCEDEAAASRFLDCDILLRDGIGMKMLCALLGVDAGLNMNGTDYIPAILAAGGARAVALLGTRRPQLDRAAAVLRKQGKTVVHTADGFSPDEDYISLLRRHRADIAVLGMGMPRQERCAFELKRALDYPCAIVCGGAIIDFLGGSVRRAPRLARAAGFEWVFRLAHEPRRLFRRYVIGNAQFIARLAVLRRGSIERTRRERSIGLPLAWDRRRPEFDD